MSNLKAVLTFDDSWDDEAVRNAFEDNDQFLGVTVSEVTSSKCGGCARQNKGSAEQQTDNTTKAEIELLLKGAIGRYREMNYAAGEHCINEAIALLSAVR